MLLSHNLTHNSFLVTALSAVLLGKFTNLN